MAVFVVHCCSYLMFTFVSAFLYLMLHYPEIQAEVSYVLREVFPNAATERTTYVNGIRLRHLSQMYTISFPPSKSSRSLSATVCHIELQTENTTLKARVAELELENRQLVQVGATLEQQMQHLCSLSCLLLHGPDTLERFQHLR